MSGWENGEIVPTEAPQETGIFDERGNRVDPTNEERIEGHEETAAHDYAKNALMRVLLLVIDSDRPRLAAYQVADAFGMLSAIGGISGAEIAKKFGISREAYEQGKDRVRESLQSTCQTRGMKKTRPRRLTLKPIIGNQKPHEHHYL
jgi:hypothetical protein